MATQAIEQVDEAAPPTKGRRVVLFLALGGILAGGAVGALALGPVLTKRLVGKAAPAVKEVPKADQATYELANLVLNPAGTDGQRFLMVTTTFQVRDAGIKGQFTSLDAEVRDRILSILGKKTISDLTTMDNREAIKRELMDSVGTMFPKGAILNLFFPQFVIQ